MVEDAHVQADADADVVVVVDLLLIHAHQHDTTNHLIQIVVVVKIYLTVDKVVEIIQIHEVEVVVEVKVI